jgi:hypothetical protein
MAKNKKKAASFPAKVWITRDPDEDFLLAGEDYLGAEDGQLVAEYGLLRVVRKTVAHSLASVKN